MKLRDDQRGQALIPLTFAGLFILFIIALIIGGIGILGMFGLYVVSGVFSGFIIQTIVRFVRGGNKKQIGKPNFRRK